MGGLQTKGHANGSELRILREKTKLLHEKLDEMMCLREAESQAYEQEMMVHALKESEWRQERKWLRKEVRRLKNDRNRGKENEKVAAGEKMERDEAVEKWKKLYLAIKNELDNLINTTHQGERVGWREEGEYLIVELRRELKAKEETIELLQAHIAAMEQEESRREREVDILRQSLRIMAQKKQSKHISKGFSRNFEQ